MSNNSSTLTREARSREVAARYLAGASLSEVAAALGIKSIETVHRDLERMGVQRRPRAEAISAARHKRISGAVEATLANAGACGSPTCPDGSSCAITAGACHAPGCRNPAAIARQTEIAQRRVRGLPGMYCSPRCAGLGRAARRAIAKHGAVPVLQCGGCGSPTCPDLACEVQPGACHGPGCEQRAVRAPKTDRERCWIAGEPTKFCSVQCAIATAAGLGAERYRRDAEALEAAGHVPLRKAAVLTFRHPSSARTTLPVERHQVGGRIRLVVNARELLAASPDPHARGKLAKPLAALNGTQTVGAPPKLSTAEVQRALALREADPNAWGWRNLAAELNTQRPAGSHVSHMTVKRAVARLSGVTKPRAPRNRSPLA